MGTNNRPDLSPAALVMAQILPVYDEAWNRLRTEYLEVRERYLVDMVGRKLIDSYTRTADSDTRRSWLKRLS